MHVAECWFPFTSTPDTNAASHAIHSLLSALRMNGQICGREWPLALRDGSCVATLLLPAPDALDAHHHNAYVRHTLAALAEAGVGALHIAWLEPDLDNDTPCDCAQRSALYPDHELSVVRIAGALRRLLQASAALPDRAHLWKQILRPDLLVERRAGVRYAVDALDRAEARCVAPPQPPR